MTPDEISISKNIYIIYIFHFWDGFSKFSDYGHATIQNDQLDEADHLQPKFLVPEIVIYIGIRVRHTFKMTRAG